MKRYRPYAPDPSYLLPPAPSDWLPNGHLASFVLDLVADLDLGEIERHLCASSWSSGRDRAHPGLDVSANTISKRLVRLVRPVVEAWKEEAAFRSR